MKQSSYLLLIYRNIAFVFYVDGSPLCDKADLGLSPANERQRYLVMMPLIGWVQA